MKVQGSGLGSFARLYNGFRVEGLGFRVEGWGMLGVFRKFRPGI